MERQLGLFVGPTLSEDQLEALLTPLYPTLWRMIREPFEDLLQRRASDHAFRILDEGETAQWLRPQIVAKARDIFAGRDDVAIEKPNGQLVIKYRNEVAITPKKFRKRWMRRRELTFSSYNTDQNIKYWHQKQVEGFDDIPRIIVGYKFVHEMTDIQVFVGYPNGKDLRFCYLMPDQSGVVAVQVPVTTVEREDKGFLVKPKMDVRRSKKAQ